MPCEGRGDNSFGVFVDMPSARTVDWTAGGYSGSPTQRTSVRFTSADSLVDGQWHHLAFVHTAGVKAANMTLHVDGAPLPATVLEDGATAYHSPGDNRTLVFMGARLTDGVVYEGAAGHIDEILVFPRALESAEVQRLFSAQYAGPPRGTLIIVR